MVHNGPVCSEHANSCQLYAYMQVAACLGALRTFSPANPTGSYVLNLSQVVDFGVAARLRTCWAVEVRTGACRPSELEVCFLGAAGLANAVGSADMQNCFLPRMGAHGWGTWGTSARCWCANG